MTEMTAVQVHCPFCNGVQSKQHSGDYECEFCLQPFSLVAAQKEESRVVEDIKRWLDQKVGSAGVASQNVDAASRSFIFGQRILPDLKRDVDRALELLGGYGQHSLLQLPIASATTAKTANPLIANRAAILGLKDLRARLASPHVTSFATTLDHQAAVQMLDRRLAEISHLSNVVDAANKGGAQGYAGAKRNLLSLLEDISEALRDPAADTSHRAYLAGLQARYRSLAELCSLSELIAAGRFDATYVAGQLAAIEKDLRDAASQIESSDYSPADSVPAAMGTKQEADGCRLLARWIAGYAALTQGGAIPFDSFSSAVDSLCRARMSPDTKAEMVETWSEALGARAGTRAIPAYDDFSWLEATIELHRAKKTFGFLGTEELVTEVRRFLLPVWLATVTYSKSEGRAFKEGVEGKCLAVADACTPAASSVSFLDAESPMFGGLSAPRRLPSVDIALPQSIRSEMTTIVQQAARAKAGLLNAQVRIESLAFIAAALVTYESKGDRRTVAFTNGGPLDGGGGVAAHIDAARKAIQTFH